jgi:hypothetical protein
MPQALRRAHRGPGVGGCSVVDHTPDQEETPELQGRYTVGDYINLDLTIWHAMHIVEASVVFVLVDDDTMELVIAG